MDATLHYYWFAREFGWTPAQVDDLPAVYVDRFAVIADELGEAARRRSTGPVELR